jgi:septum formation protein
MKKLNRRVILASESARRFNILTQLGISFQREVSSIQEGSPLPAEQPRDYTLRLASAKALAVAQHHPDALIIGADTVVVVGSKILGKPLDGNDAMAMLRSLSGIWHKVITGLCLVDTLSKRHVAHAAETDVKFRGLSDAEILSYVNSGEPLDKAGAYAIQGQASFFVEEIHGCLMNVVGFPVTLFLELCKELDFPVCR